MKKEAIPKQGKQGVEVPAESLAKYAEKFTHMPLSQTQNFASLPKIVCPIHSPTNLQYNHCILKNPENNSPVCFTVKIC